MDFSFNFRYEIDKTLMDSVQDIDVTIDGVTFNEDKKDKTWSLQNRVDYQFNQWVRGSIHFNYEVKDKLNAKKTITKDFGFDIRIKITS